MSTTMMGVPLNSHPPPRLPASGASELSISFQGKVYVFPAVTPEKVQAVLLLLGYRETKNTIPFLKLNDKKVVDDPICEKRKERCFEKKIRYTCRNEVAQRMHQKKGQFASAKSICKTSDDNLGSGYSTHHPEPVLHRCHHCGASESSTPAMRRGPAGLRTLCNACGLMWANKGTLRDLTKGGSHNFDQNTQEILKIKHVSTEPDISYLNQCGERTADQTQTALVESRNPLTRWKQDLMEITDGITDDSSKGMDKLSGKLVDQETLDELANASGSEFDLDELDNASGSEFDMDELAKEYGYEFDLNEL